MTSNERQPPDPLSSPEAWDRVASGYAAETVPYLEGYARRAIELAAPVASDRVLDLAAGPGTVSFLLAARVREIVAVDFAPSMIEELQARTRRDGIRNVTAAVMDGQALALPDASFDFAFSMFGLIFFPDRARGLAELHRVLRPKGRAVVSSWAPRERSPSMQAFFAALVAAVPEMAGVPRASAGLGDAETFMRELRGAGFEEVAIHSVVHDFPFTTVDELWASFERGNVTVSEARQLVPPSEWEGRGAIARRHLAGSFANAPKVVRSEAYLGIARRA